jgi:hypothetical protein
MKKITVEDILKHKPCKKWSIRARLERLLGKGKTLLEICKMRTIDIENRIWCIIRFLPDAANRTFALWCIGQCDRATQVEWGYVPNVEDEVDWKGYTDWIAYWAADNNTMRRKQLRELTHMVGKKKVS